MGLITARTRTIALISIAALSMGALHLISSDQRGTSAFAASECSDGIDNDGDTFVDFPEDPNCDDLGDEYEGPIEGRVNVSLTDGKETVEPGDTLFYIIRLSTHRTTPQNVDVRFYIPEHASEARANQGGAVHGSVVEWNDVVVFPNNGAELAVDVRTTLGADNGDIMSARVVVDGGTATDITEVAKDTIPASNWVDLSVTDGKTFAVPEEMLTYTILVTNREKEPRDITVRSQLPSEFVVHEITGPHRKNVRKIIWEDMQFEPKETRELVVTGHVERDAPAFFPLRFRVYSGTEIATDTTTIDSEGNQFGSLVVSITDAQTSAAPGQELTYRILLENTATSLITNLDLHAGLPQYAEFVDSDAGGEWLGNGVFWKGLTVSPSGSRTLHYTIRVRSDAPMGSSLRAGVMAKGVEAFDITDIGTSIVGAREPSQITRNALTKTADRREVRPGDVVSFTITLRNTTDHPFTNVTVEDRFDANQMRITGGAADAVNAAGMLKWNIPTIEPGSSWSTQYQMQVNPNIPHGTELRNVVSADGNGLESLSLTERIQVGRLGVITGMPKSGASMDVLFLLLTGLMGLAPVGMRMKQYA